MDDPKKHECVLFDRKPTAQERVQVRGVVSRAEHIERPCGTLQPLAVFDDVCVSQECENHSENMCGESYEGSYLNGPINLHTWP